MNDLDLINLLSGVYIFITLIVMGICAFGSSTTEDDKKLTCYIVLITSLIWCSLFLVEVNS